MINVNKHKFFLLQILKDIFSDIELAACLGFKGGTALMFFYDLPRFSVDLDFNLLDSAREKTAYEKVRKILLKYGKIVDEAVKFYGPVIVLDYVAGERNLKIEISNRLWDNHYEIRNLLGINMRVMTAPDMFAHKLCALLDRGEVINRDIFDTWFFLQKHIPVNKLIVEDRMAMTLAEYVQKCIGLLETIGDRGMMNGLGELMDDELKKFVRTGLRKETIALLKIFREFPVLA